MPITYVRCVHRKPEPDPKPATFEELEQDETILFFDPVAEATVTNVGELYRKLEIGHRANEIVVFRGAEMSFVDALGNDPILPDFLADNKLLALIVHPDAGQPAPAFCKVPKFAP